MDGIDTQASEVEVMELNITEHPVGGRPVADHAFRVDSLR